MMNAANFTWNLRGTAVVKSFGLSIPNLNLDKNVTLNGMSPWSKSNSFFFKIQIT